MFVVAKDPTDLGNGDLAVRTDKGTLVALIYAQFGDRRTEDVASVVAAALNAAFAPSHTDMMVTPAQLDAWLETNGPAA